MYQQYASLNERTSSRNICKMDSLSVLQPRQALTTLNSNLSNVHPLSTDNIWRMDSATQSTQPSFTILEDPKSDLKPETSSSNLFVCSNTTLASDKENLIQVKQDGVQSTSFEPPRRLPNIIGYKIFEEKSEIKPESIQVEEAKAVPSRQQWQSTIGSQIFKDRPNRKKLPYYITHYYFRKDEEPSAEKGFSKEHKVFPDKPWDEHERCSWARYCEDLKWTAPYRKEVYEHLKEVELQNRPLDNYFEEQKQITPQMRTVLVDWMIEVSDQYKFEPETVHIAVNYVDRILSVLSVSKERLQLLGTTALFVAAKQQEIYPPELSEFVYITDDTYTKKEILSLEHKLLVLLGFSISPATAIHFADIFCSMARATERMTMLSHYLCELAIMDAGSLEFLPSEIGAAAVSMAGRMLYGRWWSDDMVRWTGYRYADLLRAGNWLFEKYRLARKQECQAALVKYSSSRFQKVAETYCPLRTFSTFDAWISGFPN